MITHLMRHSASCAIIAAFLAPCLGVKAQQSKPETAAFTATSESIKGGQAKRTSNGPEHSGSSPVIKDRFVAIDNVCAWPNLTALRDGTIIATIFNQPSHTHVEGDVECWATADGQRWEKRGVATQHEGHSNRVNVAAGLAKKSGDLVVLASGWSLKPGKTGPAANLHVLRIWTCRSSDAGRHWTVDKDAFPPADKDVIEFIPFGDIVPGADGSLRAACYTGLRGKRKDFPGIVGKVCMFRSDDDGKTWKQMATISELHNETALFHLGAGKWLAAARSSGVPYGANQRLDLLRSDDDGVTWRLIQPISETGQVPGHLRRLRDGRLLLSYGNRIAGQFGVVIKTSSDDGVTWSEPAPLVGDLTTSDCGYPSSVELARGEILTAYYARSGVAHYHMGTVIWKLPAITGATKKRHP